MTISSMESEYVTQSGEGCVFTRLNVSSVISKRIVVAWSVENRGIGNNFFAGWEGKNTIPLLALRSYVVSL